MAKRYGELVQDLWNGHSKSITPLKFRVSFLNTTWYFGGNVAVYEIVRHKCPL